jgi:hypothetical protein
MPKPATRTHAPYALYELLPSHAQPCASGDTITRNALSLSLSLSSRTHTLTLSFTHTHTLTLSLSLFQCSDHTNGSLKPLTPLTRSLAYVAYRHCSLTMCTTRTAAAPPSCRAMTLCTTHSLTHTRTQTSTHTHTLTRSLAHNVLLHRCRTAIVQSKMTLQDQIERTADLIMREIVDHAAVIVDTLVDCAA